MSRREVFTRMRRTLELMASWMCASMPMGVWIQDRYRLMLMRTISLARLRASVIRQTTQENIQAMIFEG